MLPSKADPQKLRQRLKAAAASSSARTPLPGIPTRRIRVLLLGPEPGTEDRVREALAGNRAAEFELEIRSLLMAAQDGPADEVDVALLDLGGQDTAFAETRLVVPNAPIVVLVGSGGERRAAQAMNEGAADAVPLEELSGPLLTRCLHHAMERHRLQTALGDLTFDFLTGLYNRHSFLLTAEQYLYLAGRMHGAALLYVNIAQLRRINRAFGYREGNRALRRVANLLRAACRKSDLIGRLGGDRLGALALGPPAKMVEGSAERLNRLLEECNRVKGARYPLQVYLGMAHFAPDSALSVSALLAQAMGAASAERRNSR